MSIFSNPRTRSVEQAKAYTAAVLALVGSRDPVEVLRQTPTSLAKALRGLTEAQAITPEAPGKWSVRVLLQHLADSELVWGYRLRLVLAEDRPTLAGYDQDLWAQRLGYATVDAVQALQDFTTLRESNLRLLAHASPEDLQRVGIHQERGEESVEHMIRLYAGHDLLHLQQLARITAAMDPDRGS
jgi:uncharacterized damage-inducible protein DinB